MPRVWKHFLKNLAGPVGFVAYLFAVVVGATYANTLYENSGVGVILLFVVLPILAYLVRDMWRDAKEKVEQENREMIHRLKYSDNSDLYEK
jgi:ABC-type Fe3+ transport system permease subunit